MACVQRTADDRTGDTIALDVLEATDIVETGNAAGGQYRCLQRLGERACRFGIEALHHAVAGDVGIDDRFDTIAFAVDRGLDHIMAGDLGPAIECHASILGIQADDDMARKLETEVMPEVRRVDRSEEHTAELTSPMRSP